jgi:membrane protein implicated in regulation of membrane protease activity
MQKIKPWLKLLLLVSDELLIIFLIFFLLWWFGIHLHPGILTGIGIAVVAVVLALHKLAWPSITNVGSADPSGMTGKEGEAVERIDPEGLVRVEGETWQALAEDRPIEAGQCVKVVGIKGLKLRVTSSK